MCYNDCRTHFTAHVVWVGESKARDPTRYSMWLRLFNAVSQRDVNLVTRHIEYGKSLPQTVQTYLCHSKESYQGGEWTMVRGAKFGDCAL